MAGRPHHEHDARWYRAGDRPLFRKPIPGYEPFTPSDPEALRQSLLPGDVLLVEGNNNVSGVIKYLTQSTWSHSALYVGPLAGRFGEDGEPHVLIEANLGEGVVAAPLSKYRSFTPASAGRSAWSRRIAPRSAPMRSSASALPTI